MVRNRYGIFKLARGLLAFLIFFGLLPTNAFGAPPDPLPDRRFGVAEAFRSPNQATEIGVGWERVVFWWKALQPNSPDDWNPFYFPDDTLAQETAQGREVVGLIMTTPRWASGSDDPRSPPKNLYLPYDDPNNYWGAFVKKIASRYRGRIDTWIIWNEPDIWDSQRNTSAWLGSEADYYQLLKIAYQSARSVNPSAKIGFAGLTYWWDKVYGREFYLKRVLEIAAKDPTARANGFYFDFANVHLYNLPQQTYTISQYFKQVLADYGLTKPIWLSEVNVVPYDDPVSPLPRASYRASLDDQASFVIQAIALSLAGGVERVGLYKMQDDVVQPPNSEVYGLTRNDGSARPSFSAFRAAAKYLSGARDANWVRDKDLNLVVVPRGDRITTVLWNDGYKPLTATVPAYSSGGLIVDKYGLAAMVAPVNGNYVIVLPASSSGGAPDDARAYSIGEPFMLVEELPKTADLSLRLNREQPSLEQSRQSEESTQPATKEVAKEELARAELERRAAEAKVEQERKASDEVRRQDHIASLVAAAQSMIDRYDWQSAWARLQELKDIDPQNSRGTELQLVLQREAMTTALRSRAAELYQQQDWPGAVDALRQLAILYPEDATVRSQLASALAEGEKAQLLSMAERLMGQGLLEEAQDTFEYVLRSDPRNRRALDGIANLQVLQWYQSRNQPSP